MNTVTMEGKGLRNSSIWFYLPVPVFFVILAFDFLILSGRFADLMPGHPSDFFLFSYLFVFPHIIMSSLLFVDREMATEFRKSLIGIALLVVVYLVLSRSFFPEKLRLVIFGGVTGYHLMTQQYGIYRLFTKNIARSFNLTRWMCVGTVVLLACFIEMGEKKYQIADEAHSIVAVLLTIAGMLSVLTVYQTKEWKGRVIILFNFLAVAFFFFSLSNGYLFFGVFLIRCLHDLTALSIYFRFSKNRNQDKRQNIFAWPKGIRWGSPALGVLLAAFLVSGIFQVLKWEHLLEFLVWTHYATESIAWKNQSVFRNYL